VYLAVDEPLQHRHHHRPYKSGADLGMVHISARAAPAAGNRKWRMENMMLSLPPPGSNPDPNNDTDFRVGLCVGPDPNIYK